MSLQYTFTIYNPDPTQSNWPPTILSSDWYARIIQYNDDRNMPTMTDDYITYTVTDTFNDTTDLNAFLSEYTLTDSTLLDDINLWKTTYGITYTTLVTAEDNSTVSITPIVS
jgi:hypothetical protein